MVVTPKSERITQINDGVFTMIGNVWARSQVAFVA